MAAIVGSGRSDRIDLAALMGRELPFRGVLDLR